MFRDGGRTAASPRASRLVMIHDGRNKVQESLDHHLMVDDKMDGRAFSMWHCGSLGTLSCDLLYDRGTYLLSHLCHPLTEWVKLSRHFDETKNKPLWLNFGDIMVSILLT